MSYSKDEVRISYEWAVAMYLETGDPAFLRVAEDARTKLLGLT